ncbi:MAG: tetratricopeptide repeat protein [Chlorobi bacterium]|nr:tetratricopeptide repeat protein [Chlorobiota bacterium]
MRDDLLDKDRNVIPRWRPVDIAATTGELDMGQSSAMVTIDEKGLEDLVSAWNDHKALPYATDLMGAAFALGNVDLAREPAHYILREAPVGAVSSRSLAQRIIGIEQTEDSTKVPPSSTGNLDSSNIETKVVAPFNMARVRIQWLRKRLLREPRNAMLYLDMAHEYSILGYSVKAEQYMFCAINLAPDNRLVLRSAARMYVHQDNLEKAHSLLKSARSLYRDPWLMSAEIALANALNRSSRLVRNARQLIDSGKFSPRHLSELRAALAKLEFEAGKHRKARKLLRESLETPTENTVAQALWVANRDSDLDVNPWDFDIPRLYEAKATQARSEGDWNGTVEESSNWLIDQPFSSRPAVLGSYVSGLILQEYELSEAIARYGLYANPHDHMLLNNRAVALAHIGRLREAEIMLHRAMIRPAPQKETTAVLIATSGLLLYRQGSTKEGREAYIKAIEFAHAHGLKDIEAIAAICMASEDIRVRALTSQASLDMAIKRMDLIERPEKGVLCDRLLEDKQRYEKQFDPASGGLRTL